MESETAKTGKTLRWRELRWKTRLCLLGTLALILAVGCECIARGYWLIAKGIPLLRGDQLWRVHFPEFAEANIAEAPSTHDDDHFDVLVLAASVWNKHFGDLDQRLARALESRLGRPVRVFNLAYPGRTSLDSYQRYRRLADKRFDLVIVYHGINDNYLNNCLPALFRADYRHAARYERLLALDDYHTRWLVFPYTLHYIVSRITEECGGRDRLGKGWLDAGRLQTPASFEANLTSILDLAQQRGDPVLLMTFAYFIPDNYSEPAFAAKQLDYDNHAMGLDTWGTVDTVPAAIDAHNAIIRRLAQRPGVLFVDQRALLPDGKQTYHDPCHLSAGGCTRYIENIMTQLDWENLTKLRDPLVAMQGSH
ncbi:MAG: SGNH/GDSL hydrolase family protein [Gemmataceae bacterium]